MIGGTSSIPKLASIIQAVFPSPTTILPISYNPSELLARGAAIQASLISHYDSQTIDEAIHPVVTVVGHTTSPLGVKLGSNNVDVIIEDHCAIPCRAKRVYKSNEGGDVILEIYEGKRETEIVSTPMTPPPEEDGKELVEEQVKRRIVLPERKVAVVRVNGVKKGGEVEVLIQIDSEGRVIIVGREV